MTWLVIIVEVVSAIVAFPAILLVVRDTWRGEGRWGIRFGRRECPGCGFLLPLIRRPLNERQRLGGGSTCPGWGFESDKGGRPVGGGKYPAAGADRGGGILLLRSSVARAPP